MNRLRAIYCWLFGHKSHVLEEYRGQWACHDYSKYMKLFCLRCETIRIVSPHNPSFQDFFRGQREKEKEEKEKRNNIVAEVAI